MASVITRMATPIFGRCGREWRGISPFYEANTFPIEGRTGDQHTECFPAPGRRKHRRCAIFEGCEALISKNVAFLTV